MPARPREFLGMNDRRPGDPIGRSSRNRLSGYGRHGRNEPVPRDRPASPGPQIRSPGRMPRPARNARAAAGPPGGPRPAPASTGLPVNAVECAPRGAWMAPAGRRSAARSLLRGPAVPRAGARVRRNRPRRAGRRRPGGGGLCRWAGRTATEPARPVRSAWAERLVSDGVPDRRGRGRPRGVAESRAGTARETGYGRPDPGRRRPAGDPAPTWCPAGTNCLVKAGLRTIAGCRHVCSAFHLRCGPYSNRCSARRTPSGRGTAAVAGSSADALGYSTTAEGPWLAGAQRRLGDSGRMPV
ncbi:hypothetical protein FraQA3DRAFT_5217 [Frankia sp. QA3]|nr:hypothetical protein FraQA3DRAFT_5217 [Frankia sp. QA3]